MIENKINSKRYIGQSWDIDRRWFEHTRYESNTHLKSAYSKYGLDNFEFRVLCELKEEDEQSQERLDDLEIAYIDILDTTNQTKGYNHKSGGSYGKHSEESKAKMRTSSIGKNKGIIRSVEHQQRINISLKGRLGTMKGRKHTPEAKAKTSAKMKGKKQSIYSVYKRIFSRMGWKAEFELEAPGTKTFIGKY